jgi:hypothetical protein
MNVLHCSNLLSVDINCIRSVAATLSVVPFQSGFQLCAKRVGVGGTESYCPVVRRHAVSVLLGVRLKTPTLNIYDI